MLDLLNEPRQWIVVVATLVVVFACVLLHYEMPVGALRFMVGTEALTGLVLITGSASFAFLEMQRHWRVE